MRIATKRGDADDFRSYRYTITTPTGILGPWPWRRVHDFLVATFIAADAQFHDEAKLSADDTLREAASSEAKRPIRGRNEVLPFWSIRREGDADCGHLVQRSDCACCLRTAGRYEGSSGPTLGADRMTPRDHADEGEEG